jgi:para-nitrobenzyl esterase
MISAAGTGRSRAGRGLVVLSALVLALATLLTAGGPATPAASAFSAGSGAVVAIDTGSIKGTVGVAERRFLGIPFAAPPTGSLRFRAPQPAASWSGVRDATRHGNSCPQSYPVIGTLIPSAEDCLNVDVYTPPAAASRNLPVMVWYFGGAYVLGSNSGYDPTPLVTQGDVIVVEVNYRVGPFGFLALPGLDAETASATSGNYGLLDQQAGLRWVRRNIAAFGGDRNNVTIFGESAGGNSVCQQVASPLAAGLFERAIVESGSCSGTNGLTTQPEATMVARSKAYAASLGCTAPATMVTCLRGLPVSRLLSSPTVQLSSLTTTWVPTVDGYVEPRALDDAWRTGSYTKVPMIIGGNHDEYRLFMTLLELQKFARPSAADYATFIRQQFGASTNAILARYPASAFESPDLAQSAAMTDSFFQCPTVESIRRTTASGTRVWTYELNTTDPPLAVPGSGIFMPLGNFHTAELYYLFDTVQSIPVLSRDAAQRRLSAQLVRAWTTFARTGNPGPIGETAWPVWTPSAPETMSLSSAGSTLTTGIPVDHNCAFWAPIIG